MIAGYPPGAYCVAFRRREGGAPLTVTRWRFWARIIWAHGRWGDQETGGWCGWRISSARQRAVRYGCIYGTSATYFLMAKQDNKRVRSNWPYPHCRPYRGGGKLAPEKHSMAIDVGARYTGTP